MPHALLGYNTASSEKLLGYANNLVEQRDYYRGISVLKYVAYFAEDQQAKAVCLFKIGEAYQKSRKYKSSVEYLERYLDGTAEDTLRYRAYMYLGSNYLQLSRYHEALANFSRAEEMKNDGAGLIWAAYGTVQQGKFDAASDILRSIIRNHAEKDIATSSQEILQEIANYQASRRNARTASVLSALCPGLGQLPARHVICLVGVFFLLRLEVSVTDH